MSKIKLFVLPYAGGSATAYLKWRGLLVDTIEMVPLEMAGRGMRFGQPFYASMEEAVEDLYQTIRPQIQNSPYAFFGHSMGTCIIYELCHKIMERNQREPLWLFLSGRCAPHIARNDWLHRLPDVQFIEAVCVLGGMSQELRANQELLQLFTPVLKADHRIIEHYQYVERGAKLNCNLSVFFGQEDHHTSQGIDHWEQLTRQSCYFHPFSGGHFFINEHFRELVGLMNQALQQCS